MKTNRLSWNCKSSRNTNAILRSNTDLHSVLQQTKDQLEDSGGVTSSSGPTKSRIEKLRRQLYHFTEQSISSVEESLNSLERSNEKMQLHLAELNTELSIYNSEKRQLRHNGTLMQLHGSSNVITELEYKIETVKSQIFLLELELEHCPDKNIENYVLSVSEGFKRETGWLVGKIDRTKERKRLQATSQQLEKEQRLCRTCYFVMD